jgi:hypothetical protein
MPGGVVGSAGEAQVDHQGTVEPSDILVIEPADAIPEL